MKDFLQKRKEISTKAFSVVLLSSVLTVIILSNQFKSTFSVCDQSSIVSKFKSMSSKAIDHTARLRRKLVNNELNPIADAILSLVLLGVSPFIWMFAQIHDKLMFKFLNKTYIYNVSWEV